MKKILFSILVGGLVLSLGYGTALAGLKGNGLPPGPRYMLNVIAFDKDNCPAGDFTGSNRHMIAVEADFGTIDTATGTTSNQAGTDKNVMIKQNTIKLSMGDDFEVYDGNACGSKQGAEFILPANPYDCGTGTTNDPDCVDNVLNFQEYEVYVRLVGRPNTAIGVTTCADEADGYDVDGNLLFGEDVILCSTESVVMLRGTKNGAMKFQDKTKELLTLCLDNFDDLNFDGECDVRYPLFGQELEDYFWQWNTKGKAHAQLVFIPIPD